MAYNLTPGMGLNRPTQTLDSAQNPPRAGQSAGQSAATNSFAPVLDKVEPQQQTPANAADASTAAPASQTSVNNSQVTQNAQGAQRPAGWNWSVGDDQNRDQAIQDSQFQSAKQYGNMLANGYADPTQNGNYNTIYNRIGQTDAYSNMLANQGQQMGQGATNFSGQIANQGNTTAAGAGNYANQMTGLTNQIGNTTGSIASNLTGIANKSGNYLQNLGQNLVNTGDQNNSILAQSLANTFNGNAPSAADIQMRQGQDAAIKAAQSLALSNQGGLPPGATQRNIMDAATQIQLQNINNAAALRANETANAQNQFGNVAQNMFNNKLNSANSAANIFNQGASNQMNGAQNAAQIYLNTYGAQQQGFGNAAQTYLAGQNAQQQGLGNAGSLLLQGLNNQANTTGNAAQIAQNNNNAMMNNNNSQQSALQQYLAQIGSPVAPNSAQASPSFAQQLALGLVNAGGQVTASLAKGG